MTTLQTAIYAATVSTLLALVKLYELWKDRFHMETYLNIDGPEAEKEIVFTNLSPRPINVKYIELFWAKSKWDSKKIEVDHFDYHIGNQFQIGGFATKTIKFTEADNFGIKSKKNLYVRIHVAGRKRSGIVKKIFPN